MTVTPSPFVVLEPSREWGPLRALPSALLAGLLTVALLFGELRRRAEEALLSERKSPATVRAFFGAAAMFAGMSLYGYTTRRDLSKFGSFLIMGLIGVIIASIINIFLGSSALQFAISIIGILVFVGLTAYDTQRIKGDYVQYAYAEGTDEAGKRSVFDALSLYLNFINLFMLLLSLFGGRNQE